MANKILFSDEPITLDGGLWWVNGVPHDTQEEALVYARALVKMRECRLLHPPSEAQSVERQG